MSLKGKSALVTGAAGAVGTTVVRRFVSEGMKVVGVVHGKDSHHALDRTGLNVLTADVTDEKDVRKLFDEMQRLAGPVDILVNTVGGFLPSRQVSEMTVEEWDSMFKINLQSVFLCMREALRQMKGRPYGRIINFSAMPAFQPVAGKAPYSIAKAAVSMLTEIVAREVKGTGITVNAIAPSIIATEANKASMPEADYSKWVTPEAIADTICALCLETGGSINGTTIKAYGGV